MSAPEPGAAAPGQAAYEAYCRHVDRISPPPWEHLHSGYQDGWQQVAQAGHVVIAAREPQPAPELAEAMRESRALLGYLDDFTRAVIDLDDGARLVAIGRLARAARAVRKKAGLPPVEGR